MPLTPYHDQSIPRGLVSSEQRCEFVYINEGQPSLSAPLPIPDLGWHDGIDCFLERESFYDFMY